MRGWVTLSCFSGCMRPLVAIRRYFSLLRFAVKSGATAWTWMLEHLGNYLTCTAVGLTATPFLIIKL